MLVFGLGYLVTYTTIKNQANWEDFYKEVEKENPSILDSILEEIIYRIICKMNFWSGVGLILGVLLFIVGVIL